MTEPKAPETTTQAEEASNDSPVVGVSHFGVTQFKTGEHPKSRQLADKQKLEDKQEEKDEEAAKPAEVPAQQEVAPDPADDRTKAGNVEHEE